MLPSLWGTGVNRKRKGHLYGERLPNDLPQEINIG